MIQKKIALILTLIFLSTSAFAASNYISNDLYTYTHSGPGTKYKIMGVVNAGDKIKVLAKDKKAGYTQIQDDKGRRVWVESRHISSQPGFKKQLEKLSISADKANKKIVDLEENLNLNINKVLELEKTNLSLSTELKKIQEINETLTSKLDSEKNELLLQWFTYGGLVAGGGLLLGLILPSLIPSRQKKSRW